MGKFGMALFAGVGATAGYVVAKRRVGSDHDEGAPPHQRMVHLARIREGTEADVRRLVATRFPQAALEQSGIREMTIFVGSGYCVTEYGFTGEFTPVFAAFRADQSVAVFLEALGGLLDEEPAPFADEPGGQYLASQALHWAPGAPAQFTPHVRPQAAPSSGDRR
jgi:hypothetical protein